MDAGRQASSGISLELHSPGLRNRAAGSLFDSHELRIIIDHLKHSLTPRWTPNHQKAQRSTLYDSFELKAVANRLEKTLLAAQSGSPARSSTNLLKRFCRGKSKKMRQVGGVAFEGRSAARFASVAAERDGGGVVPRIWKRLKRVFHRN